MCLPILLNVRVGESSVTFPISPYGRSPDFISAWNPLQIPRIRPSLSRNFAIASATFGLDSTVAMNLPEPSGSSPELNPPGIISI